MVFSISKGNSLTKLEGIENLNQLRELVLDGNRVKVIEPVGLINQARLRELRIEDNQIRSL